MDRGTESIAGILNVLLFNVLPTILEVFLTCSILISQYKYYFTVATFGTIAFYVIFTLVVTGSFASKNPNNEPRHKDKQML